MPKCFLPRTSSALLPHACPVQKICKCMPSFLPYRKNYRVWVNESAGHYYSVAQLQLFVHNFSAADVCLYVRQTTADQKKYVK